MGERDISREEEYLIMQYTIIQNFNGGEMEVVRDQYVVGDYYVVGD